MPRAPLVVIACAAGLVAGCGSGAKTHTTASGRAPTVSAAKSSGPPMATVGPAGTLPRSTSNGYRATSGSVLLNLRVALVRFFTSKGFSGVTVHCRAVNAGVASCDIAGMNRSDQSSANTVTLTVNQTNGALRITHVAS